MILYKKLSHQGTAFFNYITNQTTLTMKSKVLVLVLAVMVFTFTTKAQISFGLRAGVNLQNINGKSLTGDDLEYDLKTGFHAGLNVEIPLVAGFYIQPGVLYSSKGAKGEDVLTTKEIKWSLSYIEVPVNLLYKPSLGPGKLLLGFGPYVAYAVGGSVKREDQKDGELEYENDVTLAQYSGGAVIGTYYAKRLDVGGNLLFGYEFAKKISVQLNAQLGMANINPKIKDYDNDKSKRKNTGFGISLGYRF